MNTQLSMFGDETCGGAPKQNRRTVFRKGAFRQSRLRESPAVYGPGEQVLPRSEQPASRVLSSGVAACSTAELLAALLGQKDSALGECLLSRFEGLLGLVRAGAWELETTLGIGPASAARLCAAFEIGRRICTSSPVDRPHIHSPADAASLLLPEMGVLDQEEMRVLLLDTRNRVLGVSNLYKGSLDTSLVRVGELFRDAIRRNAAGIIAAHNHPSGDPSPSPEDLVLTRMLVEAGRLLSITVIDHLVIGQQRWVSLKERGLGFN